MSFIAKRLIGMALIAAMATSMLAGCSKNSTPVANSGAPSTSGTEREHVTIRFSQPDTGIDNPDQWKNDRILAAIQEAVGVTIEWDSGAEGYADRIQTELIGGTAPDIFCNYGEQEKTSKWIKDGVVVNMGEIVSANPERYPTLKKMFESPDYKMYNEMYSGDANNTSALYALYAFKAWAGAPVYNRALLEKAGMTEAPKTVEEFVTFANKLGGQGLSGWWPRNNKLTNLNEIDKTLFAPNGTTVMAPQGNAWTGFMPVGGVGGVEGEWKLMTTAEETREVLRTLADMYKKGGLDMGVGTKDDFAQAIDEFVAGKIGAVNFGFSNYGQYSWVLDEKWMKGNPQGSYKDMVLGTTLEGKAGNGVTYSAPFWMGFNWFIPASCENPERVMDLLEFLASDKGQDLIFKGIEGVHYTEDASGNVKYNAEEWLKEGKIYSIEDGRCEYAWFAFLFAASQDQLELEASNDWYKTSMNPILVDTVPESDAKTYANGVVDSYKDKAYGELPAYFTIIQFPNEINDKRVKMNELTLRYVPSFITGQMNLDSDWDKYVAEYEAAGAKDVEAAFNTARAQAKASYDKFKA